MFYKEFGSFKKRRVQYVAVLRWRWEDAKQVIVVRYGISVQQQLKGAESEVDRRLATQGMYCAGRAFCGKCCRVRHVTVAARTHRKLYIRQPNNVLGNLRQHIIADAHKMSPHSHTFTLTPATGTAKRAGAFLPRSEMMPCEKRTRASFACLCVEHSLL